MVIQLYGYSYIIIIIIIIIISVMFVLYYNVLLLLIHNTFNIIGCYMWYAILVGCANGLITFTSDLYLCQSPLILLFVSSCISVLQLTLLVFSMLLKVLTTYSNTNLSGTHTQHWQIFTICDCASKNQAYLHKLHMFRKIILFQVTIYDKHIL